MFMSTGGLACRTRHHCWAGNRDEFGSQGMRASVHLWLEGKGIISEFRDVVCEDAVFDNNTLSLIRYLDVT